MAVSMIPTIWHSSTCCMRWLTQFGVFSLNQPVLVHHNTRTRIFIIPYPTTACLEHTPYNGMNYCCVPHHTTFILRTSCTTAMGDNWLPYKRHGRNRGGTASKNIAERQGRWSYVLYAYVVCDLHINQLFLPATSSTSSARNIQDIQCPCPFFFLEGYEPALWPQTIGRKKYIGLKKYIANAVRRFALCHALPN